MTTKEAAIAGWEQGDAIEQMCAVLAHNGVLDNINKSFRDASIDGIPLWAQYTALLRITSALIVCPHVDESTGNKALFGIIYADAVLQELDNALDTLARGKK